MQIYSPIIGQLEQHTIYETQRAAIVAHNVANIDSENYHRISFSDALAFERKKLGLTESDSDDYGHGEVVLEKEMSVLGKSKIKHASYLRLLNIQNSILKKVFSQGKG